VGPVTRETPAEIWVKLGADWGVFVLPILAEERLGHHMAVRLCNPTVDRGLHPF